MSGFGKWAVVGMLAGLWPCLAEAQNTVIVQPSSVGSLNVSGAVAVGGTFQQVFASNKARRGCAVQNNGTHTMWVTAGLGVAGSTTSNAMVLNPSDVYHCGDSIVTLTGEIDITGTISEAFYASQY